MDSEEHALDPWEAQWAPYDDATYAAVLAAIEPSDVVLDIGAGDLRLARQMARVARRVIAWEVQPHLLKRDDLTPNVIVRCTDARMETVPPGVTVAVLLMRHCTHYALYVAKLRAAGCRRLITNARWGMGLEMVALGPGASFASVALGWYACRRCGAVGWVGEDATLVTQTVLEKVLDVEGCPRCGESSMSQRPSRGPCETGT